MHRFWPKLRRAFARTFPSAQPYAQAAAFNTFLALFPMLLVVLGVLTITPRLSTAVEDLINRLLAVLPFGSRQTVIDYLLSFGQDPLKWIVLGAGGTLFAGSGAMSCLMQGFRVVQREENVTSFWREQFRALGLLGVTLLPWMVSALILVFGGQFHNWVIRRVGFSTLFNLVWTLVYTSLALVLAMITLSLIYRFGQQKHVEWQSVWPGTLVATGLYWVVSSVFGAYVRRVPYTQLYGGLAAAIGLLVWLYLIALVVFVGAAFNAEVRAGDADPVYVDTLGLKASEIRVTEPAENGATSSSQE